MIQIENISKHYGQLKALSDVSFSMTTGEVVGLLGVNGAGKSTLMKILSGIITPDTGKVTFFGKDLLTGALDIKAQIGYLSEDNPLYDDMYVREYLDYVRGIYHADTSKIEEVIEHTGLKNEYKKKISNLSKGNRQRVGIAQALINDPTFLILDEATVGLDPSQRDSLNRLFLDLSKDKIILFSTHILSEVKEICSRFVLLDEGRLISDRQISDIDSVESLFREFANKNYSYENNSR